MKNANYFFLVIVLFLTSCTNSEVKNKTVVESVPMRDTVAAYLNIDLSDILGKKEAVDISIAYDQYFKKSKKFLGYELKPLLDSIIKVKQLDTTGLSLVFECIDGYKPVMALSKAFGKNRGYIVFKDKEAKDNRNWADSLTRKFSPYYLVWENVDSADHSFPWPYGLTKIQMVPTADEYQKIYPFKDPSVMKGFTLFKDNCNKCHAVNRVGGVMGPEFNIPKSITEYWQEEDIVRFAQNPKSYRISSQMPPLGSTVKQEELTEIVHYLKYMAKNKIN